LIGGRALPREEGRSSAQGARIKRTNCAEMPLPRLDFAVHDRPGQTVFVLELDPVPTRGAWPTFGPLVYMLGGSLCWAGESCVPMLAMPPESAEQGLQPFFIGDLALPYR